ncbi:hypothetical protein PsYK624_073070 [Phanerochaete sordida]|uniref:Uncharacterized protein n=1 Tax=Phanerochaete sordida TaxID=48140 RepID=A0A9P3G883_9APHY|nr:hypothetical protein PsYK624_073070 [Phanerochaete sordida]
MSTIGDFNVSLEPHLVDTLLPLLPILPETLSNKLAVTLEEAAQSTPPPAPSAAPEDGGSTAAAPPLIRYSLISSVAAWARSPDGRDALSRRSPPLEPANYTMVALLAGTRTSPEKNFPHIAAKPDASQEASRELNDRRAVTAVLNALLSVIGSGVATWWAADRLHWKQEWKALFALSVAILVAASEAILFTIWDARRSKRISKMSTALRSQGPTTRVPADDASEGAVTVPEDGSQAERTQLPVEAVPAATPAMQEHRTGAGLRERRQPAGRRGRKPQ